MYENKPKKRKLTFWEKFSIVIIILLVLIILVLVFYEQILEVLAAIQAWYESE